MSGSQPEVVWQREAGVLWRRSGRSLVMKAPVGDDIVAVDGPGYELWQELSVPTTLPTIADRLSDRYRVGASQLVSELTPVLEDLERRRLVQRRSA